MGLREAVRTGELLALADEISYHAMCISGALTRHDLARSEGRAEIAASERLEADRLLASLEGLIRSLREIV